MQLEITWDIQKEQINIKKHKVEFDEAATVFFDQFSVTFYDEDHSIDEDREITIGLSGKFRLLLVVHTERTEEGIRIISARKATSREKRDYEEGI